MTIPAQRSSRAFSDTVELVNFILPAAGGTKYGYNQAPESTRNSAAVSLVNDTSNQSPFGAAKDAFSLAAASRYRFNGCIDLDTGATSHTTLFGFLLSGGLTVTSINVWVTATSPASANAPTAAQITQLDAATGTPVAVTAASTAPSTQLLIQGELITLVAGVITPVIAFGTAPGGTNTGAIGSYFEFWLTNPSGTDALGNVA